MTKAIICDIQGVLINNGQINKDFVDFLIDNKDKYDFLILHSNLSSRHINNLKKTIPDFFSHVNKVYSYDSVKYPKPDPRGLGEILEEFSINPEDVVFVDDSKINVEAAERLGLQVVHYKNFEDISILNSFLSP